MSGDEWTETEEKTCGEEAPDLRLVLSLRFAQRSNRRKSLHQISERHDLDLFICFGFRDSDFEFYPVTTVRLRG